ncbi:hypothetical protein [Moritella sp. Urea-trap-13]|uniref:hypothetical protein n=1 Tax=Moritella sp. Urea-trap-13 TaxID=2058327 RepID=UPI0012FF1A2B|nr:hypothetical protein [Moritella sp. Urea-trap-13]
MNDYQHAVDNKNSADNKASIDNQSDIGNQGGIAKSARACALFQRNLFQHKQDT